MSWISKEFKPHVCSHPPLDSHDMDDHWVGSLWECDMCSKVWEIIEWSTPGGWDLYGPRWKEVHDRAGPAGSLLTKSPLTQ